MNAAKQASWLFALLILFAASGWYFAQEAPKILLDDQTLANTSDATVTQINLRQFDKDGRLINQLQSSLMQHIPKRNRHLLKDPQILVSQEQGSPWIIQSKDAESWDKGQKITFRKEVIVHQNAGENNEESTLLTDNLTYFPEQKLATTEDKVIFKQPGSTVHSQGMRAFLDKKHVELLGKARIIYEPRHA